MKKIYDTIIIGAGPAGVQAALQFEGSGKKVLLLDANEKLAKKILVTGNGRCNVTNTYQNISCYRSKDPRKVQAIYDQFPWQACVKMFEGMGVRMKDRDGYLYPYNDQAGTIREALAWKVQSIPEIELALMHRVVGIKAIHELDGVHKFTVSCIDESHGAVDPNDPGESLNTFIGTNVMIATGGLAGVRLNCNGDGYGLARKQGVKTIKPLPALTSLKSSAPFIKRLSGVRCRAKVTVHTEIGTQKETHCDIGEVQFTDYGISGVVVFNVSRYAVTALDQGGKVIAELDLMPDLSEEELTALLSDAAAGCPYYYTEGLLRGFLAEKLVPVLLKEAGMERERPVTRFGKEDFGKLAHVVKTFVLKINGFMGFDKAQTTCGGVALSELDENLMVKEVPGLYFAGEVVDVEGICGGYNIQWALSSGYVAGNAARGELSC